MLGSPAAEVTLVEWADPQCPACRTYTEEFLPSVVDEYVRPGMVNTEFRGFPFIGDDSVKAYRSLLAAGEQNKLSNLQEALYRNQGGRERRVGEGRPDPRARVRNRRARRRPAVRGCRE